LLLGTFILNYIMLIHISSNFN